jgi:hypothetical protein
VAVPFNIVAVSGISLATVFERTRRLEFSCKVDRYPYSDRRVMPSTSRYVTALLSALNLRSPQPELLHTLDNREWQRLLVFGDQMHLTIPLCQAFESYCPSWVRERVERNVADNTQRFQTIKTTYTEIADALKRANVDHLVLKGFTKAPEYVPNPRHRIQSDIDLFCLPETVVGARDALSALGFRSQHRVDDLCEHLPPLRRKTAWQWRGNAYDPQMPLAIELHHSLWDYAIERCGPEGISDFWHRRVERRLEEISFSALCSIDSLGYLALNLVRDLLRGTGLVTSQVYELAWFLHRNSRNKEFWNSWTAMHESALRRLESVSFLLAQTWFDCDLAETVAAEIGGLPLRTQRWFDSPATCPSPMGWLRPNTDGIWLHSSLLETTTEKRKVIFDRLLPRVLPLDAAIASKVPSNAPTEACRPYTYYRYIVYLFTRASYHLWVLPTTLWHGFRWWRSARS